MMMHSTSSLSMTVLNRSTTTFYFDALAKREGFRDVINARFGSDMIAHIDLPKFSTVAYESDSESHPQYVRPDYYTMRLVLDNGICGISQSTDLTLLVKYPSLDHPAELG